MGNATSIEEAHGVLRERERERESSKMVIVLHIHATVALFSADIHLVKELLTGQSFTNIDTDPLENVGTVM